MSISITNVMAIWTSVMAGRRAKKSNGWHAEQIKAAVRMRGTTLSKLATDNDLHESACRSALIRSQPKAEKVISAYLGIALHELWPNRYDRDGLRIRHVRDEKYHDHDENHRLSARVA